MADSDKKGGADDMEEFTLEYDSDNDYWVLKGGEHDGARVDVNEETGRWTTRWRAGWLE